MLIRMYVNLSDNCYIFSKWGIYRKDVPKMPRGRFDNSWNAGPISGYAEQLIDVQLFII